MPNQLTTIGPNRAPLVISVAGLLLLAACAPATSPSTAPSLAPASVPESAPASVEASETAEASEPAAGAARVEVGDSDLGEILTDADGLTLYIFTNDTDGTSTCNEGCVDNWPPLTVEDGEEPTAGEGVTAELGTTQRDDGTTQVTVNGMPAYHFAADSTPGDVNGQGMGDVWFVIGPDGEMIAA